MLTELELIEGCLREDRECQLEVFRRYAGKMLTVCRRYARHHMEAEDILQDAFIKVYDNLHKFQNKGSFEGWIRRIVVNTALKNYQKSSYQKERIGLEDYDDRPIDPDAISLLQEEELMDLIEKLPDGYRVVFNLFVIEGIVIKK
jgi:RNA polymerase sigma factor (sigma-70 family)